jgi:hypothetical protein
MERHRLVWRLWNRTQELQTRERKLETQQRALKRQERALKRERREIRQLRLQVQSLDRRLHELRGSRTWELVQKLKKPLDRGTEGKAVSLAEVPTTKSPGLGAGRRGKERRKPAQLRDSRGNGSDPLHIFETTSIFCSGWLSPLANTDITSILTAGSGKC